ncbi:MAG: alpha/beta hydrolase [Candidatus Dojkabacteria bacterium]|nr:MAG: alpha/beta hydrolase [Candidatus Dojkabacteria bacterium]
MSPERTVEIQGRLFNGEEVRVANPKAYNKFIDEALNSDTYANIPENNTHSAHLEIVDFSESPERNDQEELVVLLPGSFHDVRALAFEGGIVEGLRDKNIKCIGVNYRVKEGSKQDDFGVDAYAHHAMQVVQQYAFIENERGEEVPRRVTLVGHSMSSTIIQMMVTAYAVARQNGDTHAIRCPNLAHVVILGGGPPYNGGIWGVGRTILSDPSFLGKTGKMLNKQKFITTPQTVQEIFFTEKTDPQFVTRFVDENLLFPESSQALSQVMLGKYSVEAGKLARYLDVPVHIYLAGEDELVVPGAPSTVIMGEQWMTDNVYHVDGIGHDDLVVGPEAIPIGEDVKRIVLARS